MASAKDHAVNLVDKVNRPGISAQEMLETYNGRAENYETLRKNGFTNIDALDASAEMLEQAKAKNVYNKIFCQFFTSEESPNIAAVKMASVHERGTNVVENVTRPGISVEEMIDTYKGWAENYDKEIHAYGRKTPDETVSSITRIETDKNCYILDVAAGTGIVGEMLRQNGFTNIDALDASAEMLELAKAKNVYNKIFCQFITGEESPNIAIDTYDVVACVGAFYPGHLDQTCFPEIMRILKKGGRFYFTRACHRLPGDLEISMDEMEKKGILKIYEKRLVKNIHTHGDGYVYVLQKC